MRSDQCFELATTCPCCGGPVRYNDHCYSQLCAACTLLAQGLTLGVPPSPDDLLNNDWPKAGA